MPTTMEPMELIHTLNVSALAVGDVVTNLGVVNAVRREGVFVIANIRGDVWSLASGTCHTASLDVVWHSSQEVVVGVQMRDLDRFIDAHPDAPCHADQGEPCSCSNGIGCVHVPVGEW